MPVAGIRTTSVGGELAARWYIRFNTVFVLSVTHADGSREVLTDQPTLGEAYELFEDYQMLWNEVRRDMIQPVPTP